MESCETSSPSSGPPAALAAAPASDALFRLLVESVQDYAIFLLDPSGRVASWNLGAERISGYRAEEILGQPIDRFYTAADRAEGRRAR